MRSFDIRMTHQWIGGDLLVVITGGREHIGSVSAADSGTGVFSYAFPGHRDDVVSGRVSSFLSGELCCRVAVLCGIHYDNITREEITEVLEECDRSAAALLSRIKKTH